MGNLGCHVGQHGGDVLVGKAMKSVALHTCSTKFARERHDLGNGRLAAMKARVEAGDLRYGGKPLGNGFNGGEVVWLMKRCERYECAEVFENLRGHDRR